MNNPTLEERIKIERKSGGGFVFDIHAFTTELTHEEAKEIFARLSFLLEERRCCGCGRILWLENFRKEKAKRLGRSYICYDCGRKHDKEYGQKIRESGELNRKRKEKYHLLKRENPAEFQKFVARDRARYAIKAGKLPKGNCTGCGTDEDLQMHHDDYNKPLEVTWLCRQCHVDLHFPDRLRTLIPHQK